MLRAQEALSGEQWHIGGKPHTSVHSCGQVAGHHQKGSPVQKSSDLFGQVSSF